MKTLRQRAETILYLINVFMNYSPDIPEEERIESSLRVIEKELAKIILEIE